MRPPLATRWPGSPDHAESAADRPAGPSPDFAWWRTTRFGLFLHWGPSSLSGGEISWSRASLGSDHYDSLPRRFNPVNFHAADWVSLAKDAGMGYIVLTAKHHDGFLLWHSWTSDHTVENTPFARDVVAELAAAAKEAGLPFCIYFSPGDWKDPDCRHAVHNPRFVERMHNQLTELLTRYGRIPLVWIDFDGWPNPSPPAETAALIRRLQPGVLLTNRLEALHSDESHGRLGPWGDYATPEQFVGAYCDAIPWETSMTLGDQWSWKPNDSIKSLRLCLEILSRSVCGDGNLLLNVGPRPDGQIEPAQACRLREMGAWLKTHGEAVYGTRGGPYMPDRHHGSTRTSEAVYLHVYADAPETLELPPLPLAVKNARLLDDAPVRFTQTAKGLAVRLPAAERDGSVNIIKLTVDGDPLSLPAIAPFSRTGSLAYRRPAVASSSIAPLFMHGAEAAFDDDCATWWTPGRDEEVASGLAGYAFPHLQNLPDHPVFLRGGWLRVDLGEARPVRKAWLSEPSSPHYRPVEAWRIACADSEAGPWRAVASGTAIGSAREVEFSASITARHFRLEVAASGRPALAEFQLFGATAS